LYLEVLSDLPWSKLSWQVAKERQNQALSSKKEREAAHSSPINNKSLQQQQLALGVSPLSGLALSLKEARTVLDSQHYGLDKIKDR
jgi:ATP-dependent Lon protease